MQYSLIKTVFKLSFIRHNEQSLYKSLDAEECVLVKSLVDGIEARYILLVHMYIPLILAKEFDIIHRFNKTTIGISISSTSICKIDGILD